MQEQAREWVRSEVFYSYMVGPVRRVDEGGEDVQYIIPASHIKKEKDPIIAVKREIQRGFYQVHGVATRSPARSTCLLRPTAFSDAKVVRVVNALPDDQRHWVKFAYCPEESYSWDDEKGAVVALWKAYQPQVGGVRAATLQKLKGLAHLCVQDMKVQVSRGKGIYSPARLRDLLGVQEANWRRDWSPRWRAMQAIVRELDNTALSDLGLALAEIPDEHVA